MRRVVNGFAILDDERLRRLVADAEPRFDLVRNAAADLNRHEIYDMIERRDLFVQIGADAAGIAVLENYYGFICRRRQKFVEFFTARYFFEFRHFISIL